MVAYATLQTAVGAANDQVEMNAPHVSLPVKLFLSYVLVGVLIAVPPFVILRRTLVSALVGAESERLLARARFLREPLQKTPPAELEARIRSYGALLGDRLTVVARDGTVTADSQLTDQEIAQVENHANRPEIIAALATGLGTSVRFSTSVKRDLIYVAIPLDDSHPPQHILRIASSRNAFVQPIETVLQTLRLSSGAGTSAALLLMLAAALLVSRPLRQMRDAAREFAHSNWVAHPPIRTRDELQELSEALDELGRQMRQQLVNLGASDSILVQVLDRLDVPAAVTRADGSLVHLNGGFRTALRLHPEREEAAVVALGEQLRQSHQSNPASETLRWRDPTAGVTIQAWTLVRPEQEPWWLWIPEVGLGPEVATEAVARQLRTTDAALDALWSSAPSPQRLQLGALRLALDELMRAIGPQADGNVTARSAPELIGRSAEQVLSDPALHDRVVMAEVPNVALAECGGMAALIVRHLLRAVAGNVRLGERAKVAFEVEASRVRLRVQGGTPTPEWAASVPRGMGTEVELDRVDREVSWLSLPRA